MQSFWFSGSYYILLPFTNKILQSPIDICIWLKTDSAGDNCEAGCREIKFSMLSLLEKSSLSWKDGGQ